MINNINISTTILLKQRNSNIFNLLLTHDTKSLWKEINKLCNFGSSKSRNIISIKNLLNDGQLITDPLQIATKLNEYFCDVEAKLASDLPPSNPSFHFKDYLPHPLPNSFVCDNISPSEISNVIDKLKSRGSAGPDVFNANFIYSIKHYITIPLSYIFNLSINTGEFPSKLKEAKTVPIFKKGDSMLASNYRPISLLSIFSKIFETIVSSRLTSFLTKYNILYEHQYGFRSNHSTTLAVLDSVDEILTNLDKKHYVVGVFFDLSKAFDSLEHSILLDKLYNYGIRGIMLNWFSSYLADRSQYVCVNETSSPLKPINFGVPQGSVLGPLLFLLFINDIGNIPDIDGRPKLFADDTNLFISSSSLSTLEIKTQNSINAVSNWMLANRLTLNSDKTYYMLFSPFHTSNVMPANLINFSVNGSPITRVKSCKYLGVFLDDNLSWRVHINELCNQLRKYTGIFYKLSALVPPKILNMLYFSLIYPRLLYAIEIYGNTFSSYLHDLRVLNNRILRIFQHKNFRASTVSLYTDYNTLDVYNLFTFQTLLHAHKLFYKSNILPSSFQRNSVYNYDVHSHFTRSHNSLHRSISNSSYGLRLSQNLCSKLWSQLPATITTINYFTQFKSTLKSHLQLTSIS